MNYILFDGPHRNSLLPFTFTRPVADIRIGILTIREKWERYLGARTSTLTELYLSRKYPLKEGGENILINGSCLPDQALVKQVLALKPGEALVSQEEVIAANSRQVPGLVELTDFNAIPYAGKLFQLKNTWDIFSRNGEALEDDFQLLTKGRKSAVISKTNQLINKDPFFIDQ